MLVLLDTTVLSNFARVELDHVPLLLWTDQVSAASAAIREYLVGVQIAGLPRLVWKELRIIQSNPDELTFEETLPNRLGRGERASIAVAFARGAAIATDDWFARQVARNLGISLTDTVGILQRCIHEKLLSANQAHKALEAMITWGYHSPTRYISDK